MKRIILICIALTGALSVKAQTTVVVRRPAKVVVVPARPVVIRPVALARPVVVKRRVVVARPVVVPRKRVIVY